MQGGAQDLAESAAAYSTKWPDLLASWSQEECCWKTSQHSLLADSETFSEPWPRSGTMLSGIAYQLPPLARPTGEIGYGFWPTPTASGFEVADVDGLLARRQRMAEKHGNNGFGLTLNQAVKIWPTPTSRDWKDGTANSCKNVPVNGLLGRAVHQWPTPHANCHTGPGQAPNKQGGENLQTAAGGSLNPPWVEWLMGFPVGWTDLSSSETPSSPKSRS